MTPILFGRWQTRIFLLATIGLIVSLPFAFGFIGPEAGNHDFHPIFFWVVFWVGVLGLLWDILYNYLQQYLWDHDWPGAFQFFACIAEGIVLGLLLKLVGLPFINRDEFNLPWFIVHYTAVSIITYFLSWAVMRILFPRWRFRGGKWV